MPELSLAPKTRAELVTFTAPERSSDATNSPLQDFQLSTTPNTRQVGPIDPLRVEKVVSARTSECEIPLLSGIAHLPAAVHPTWHKGIPAIVRKILGPKRNGELVASIKGIFSRG